MDGPNDQRTLGNHEARLDLLEKKLDEVGNDVKQILSDLASNKGGWRTLTALGSVSAVIGGIVAEFLARRWGG